MTSRLLLAMSAALLMPGCGGSESPDPAAAPKTAPVANSSTKPPDSGPAKGPAQEDSAESLAKALLDDAARREKPDRPELAQSGYHDVCVRHPFTQAGRMAAARCVELEASLQKAIDLEFEKPRQDAVELTKAGRFGEAVAGLARFGESTKKDPLKRRAAALIANIENSARQEYGKAVRAAKTAATAGSIDEAVRLLKSAAQQSIPQIQEPAEVDLQLLDQYRQAQEAKRTASVEEGARKAFGDRAQRLLKRLKERAYAEVIKDLDAALADPALAPCKDLLAADRAAAAAAAAFWEAIQKGLKARLNQEVAFLLADGKFARGTLKRIHENGVSFRLEGSPADVQVDALHSDQLLVLAISRDGLPEDAGASYAAASMWFFLEGRHAVSRLELATAAGLGADVTVLETAWRRGFFRSALGK